MDTAAVFTDYMVLQREKRIAVFGTAAEGERITAALGNHTSSAIARDGKWLLHFPPMAACEHLTLTVSGDTDTLVFKEIAVGEVWLCGGQSNMEFEIRNDLHGADILHSLSKECGIRYYYTQKLPMIDADFAAAERNAAWTEAAPDTAEAWSAVGLYFALTLRKYYPDIPIGLIGCNWGGTSASAWIPRETIAETPCLLPYLDDYDNAMVGKTTAQHLAEYAAYTEYQSAWQERADAYSAEHPDVTWTELQAACGESQYPGPMGPNNPNRPAGLYETMLSRIAPYSIRGFLYYQGESDDHAPDTYAALMTALIGKWRKDFGDAQMPFLFVQLPMFRYRDDPDFRHWCRIREAQMHVFQNLRNTGLAVIPDCGEWNNIHPRDKSQVGYRLALQALSVVYGRFPAEDTTAPMYRDFYVCGDTLTVQFDYASDGFEWHGVPAGFEVAGEDGVFHPAEAELGYGEIILHSDAVSAPQNARYAWTNYMKVTLFGANGLPVAPFRTDSFEEADS